MNWTKLLYILIIVLIYIPMVFLGANVFFPEYTGTNSYYKPTIDCYSKFPTMDASKATEAQWTIITEKQQKCQEQQNLAQTQWESKKQAYDGQKYVFISLFNLIVLGLALFLPTLQDSVTMGLFLGSIGATFGATLGYFETRSKIGFIVLVITFFLTLYFINRKKDTFVDWKEKR